MITEHFSTEEKKCIGNRLQNCCIENLSNIVKFCDQSKSKSKQLLKKSIAAMDRMEKCLQYAFSLHILNENDLQLLNQETYEIRMLIKNLNVNSEM